MTDTRLLKLPAPAARYGTLAGALIAFAGTFLSWTYTEEFPGNLTVNGYPGGLQLITLTGALLTALLALAALHTPGLRWLTPGGPHSAVRLMALGTLAATLYTVIAIAVELDGLIALDPGAWISLVGSLVATAAAFGLPDDTPYEPQPGDTALHRLTHTLKAPAPAAPRRTLPAWADILVIAVAFGLALYVFTYGIDIDSANSELFIGYLILVALGALSLARAGLFRRLATLTARHRAVSLAAMFVAAICFPFTQDNDTYALIGTNILIFATVALGLNVVVGLAGLLDLGYVAFLGVGAYTAALVSGSPQSSIGVHFPFPLAVLTGAAVSLIFGVVIGAPTLRLRGDYLAIVTLGFGEIFRITMNNLNGNSGPDLVNGSQGIPNIPDLEMFGFKFGEAHDVLGFPLGRSGNYFLLMLLFTAIVLLVFHRSGQSRIGRAWVAIREDETAASAMGINGFRLKLLAFALGATLAGLAGTVQAHVNYSVTPEQYQFAGTAPPNSAFLIAAVILGGMGTITGPLIGAALLFLIPEKLEFMQKYQLLLFGLALILLMRLRPEGIVPDRRKQLEFHENDQLAVPEQRLIGDNEPEAATGVTKAGA
ncbi:branched-chain amino acid ABC transporter permease [Streptomyces sp. SID11385]|uniref:branched-chain amino acid ABC transporter permease n=1 Tax=Streptomyces sp. SID11385 TaxID=2706031 RepID=UPI001943434D|nr:branched-chain amino acid ABC transporter permease [Streptomyces sp. SID11385]